MRLALAKGAKALRKRRAAAQLARGEDAAALLERAGLPREPEARAAAYESLWAPLLPAAPAVPGEPELRRRADDVLAGTQILFGIPCAVGWPPRWDWRWDGAPHAHDAAADKRSTWEIQRLQGILPLAWASRAPGADRECYAGAYLDALESFHRAYPGPATPAWESALEVGLRLIALAQALPHLLGTRALRERDLIPLALLDGHARWLAADLSLDKVLPGNHLLGELAGLLAAGHLLPGARAAWWEGRAPGPLLAREILRQFHPDGVSVEQSLPYEKFILEFLLAAGELARARNEPFSPRVRERLLAAATHLEAVADPSGRLPLVGDNDSGRGAAGGDDDPARLGGLPDRLREVMGPGHTPAWRAENGLEVRVFPEGGHVVARTADGDHLFLRAGPFGWGDRGPCAHSHADWLAPVLSLAGEAVLVDPGVHGYLVADRDAYRRAEAHSALSWTPSRPPHPAGVFRWSDLSPRARLSVQGETLGGEVVWSRGGSPLRWRRSLHYNHLDETWLIHDQLQGVPEGPTTWTFRLAPGIRLEPAEDEGVVRIALPSGRRYLVRFTPAGSLAWEEAWIAPGYGRRVRGVVLRRSLGPEARASWVHIAPAGT